jgi:hypothetical protein
VPIRPLQLYADGGYQLRIRRLEGTPNYGPRQLARRLFTPDTPDVTLDSPVVFSPQCHLELAVRATVPSAPDSPACGTEQSGVPPDGPMLLSGQSDCDNTSSLLGLFLIFLISSFEVLLSSMPW